MQAEQAAPPRAFLIQGVETTGEESQAVIFPYDGSEVARVWLASAADVERALAGAAAAEPLVAAIPPTAVPRSSPAPAPSCVPAPRSSRHR